MSQTIYLVREFNLNEESDLIAPTTVWACVGPSGDYQRAGTKVAGPVPLWFADRMIEGLTTLLQRLGHKVIVEPAADD